MRAAALAILAVIITAALTLVPAATTAGEGSDLPKVASASSQPPAPNQVDAPRVKAGATYRASIFPLALRVTVPGESWRGAQGRSLGAKGLPGTRGGFGWVELYQPAPRDSAYGYIAMITAYGRTPSVAATVSGLRTRGRGATYQDSAPVTIGGFSGIQFDGEIVGPNHHFVPFTPKSSAARFYPDEYTFESGEVFRVIVLNVRGKTVVVFVDSVLLAPENFPAFLTKSDQILKSLKFAR